MARTRSRSRNRDGWRAPVSPEADPATGERWVCVGAIGAPKGVDGTFTVKAFTETPDGLRRFARFRLGRTGREVKLDFLASARKGLLARIEGVTSREEARLLAGSLLHVRREELPPLDDEADENAFYLVDLVGLAVQDTAGRSLGKIGAVQDFGAGDLLEILLDEPLEGFGRHLLLPFERSLVPKVEVERGLLVVDLDAWLARHADREGAAGRASQTADSGNAP